MAAAAAAGQRTGALTAVLTAVPGGPGKQDLVVVEAAAVM